MGGDEILHIGRPFAKYTHMASYRGKKGPRIALLPRNQTSVVCCSDSSQGRVSMAWGLHGLLERRQRILSSQGLGIRTPERDLFAAWWLLLNNVVIVIVPGRFLFLL